MNDLPIICLGGGPSLIGWDFNQLKDYYVVGCNSAYKLGPKIVDEIVFQDYAFHSKHREGLIKYWGDQGVIITNNSSGAFRAKPYIKQVTKLRTRLSTDHENLFWGGCVGHSAINRALLEARDSNKQVLLLGFDHQQINKRNNWYTKRDKPDKFPSYEKGFDIIASSTAFDTKIINLNPDSKLEQFEKQRREDYFG